MDPRFNRPARNLFDFPGRPAFHSLCRAQHPIVPSRPAAVFLLLAVLLVLFLRNDFWNWNTPGYLLFGFLPVGLWWQGLVSILASILMWLMVRLAWPAHLEQAEHESTANPGSPPEH